MAYVRIYVIALQLKILTGKKNNTVMLNIDGADNLW